MTVTIKRRSSRRAVEPHVCWQRLGEASCVGDETSLRAAHRLSQRMPSLSADAFVAANTVTRFLLAQKWRYHPNVYSLPEMVERRAGNCLGLSCLYGALLEARGLQPTYELVVGPKAFHRRDEQVILDHLLGGHVFSFESPLLPERAVRGCELLHFCTLEHPRLVLEGKRFETTTLAEQEPSEITAESVRVINYQQLVSMVLYERAHGLCDGLRPDLALAQRLLERAHGLDPQNAELVYEQSTIALQQFDDESFDRAFATYTSKEETHSQYYLQRHYLSGSVEDLDRGLVGNPTDMRLWTLRHVVFEQDQSTQRANFAVVAQCVARSEFMNLGTFYAQHAYLLAKLFPNDAVSLLKRSRDAGTNPFVYHLALVGLGLSKKVRWSGKDTLDDHLAPLLQELAPTTPWQETRLAWITRNHPECRGRWDSVVQQYGGRRTFRDTVAILEHCWN